MRGDKIIQQLRLKMAGAGKNIMLGRVFVQNTVDALEDLQKQNRQLKDALDSGNRDLFHVKEENERLNRENLWLTGGIEKR